MLHKHFFLITALLVSIFAGRLVADTLDSKKTFMALRPLGVNLALEKLTWHEHAYKKHADATIKTHFQATPFFQKSQHRGNVGQYFGIENGKNSFTVGDTTAESKPAEISANRIIHDQTHIPSALAGTVTFNPAQELYGVRLDLFQDINHPFAKVFFKASAPFVHVENDMHLQISDDATAAQVQIDDITQPEAFTLDDFFKGTVSVTADGSRNLQNPLTHAKIAGPRDHMGMADLDLALGYKFVYREKKHCFVSLDLTIPTGNRVRGEYLFAPLYGNGRHTGLGASVDAGMQIWQLGKSHIDLWCAARYKYLFQNNETRTLGIKDFKLGHYFMAGVPDQRQGVALFPAANALTQNVCVRPGSLFDTLVNVSFNSSNVTIDLSYSLFWKDEESVHVKDFTDGALALAKPNYDTNNNNGFEADQQLKVINRADLDIDAVKTPALLSHKLSAGLGYTTKMYQRYLATIAIGAAYEIGTTQADLENYMVWLKGAFSF